MRNGCDAVKGRKGRKVPSSTRSFRVYIWSSSSSSTVNLALSELIAAIWSSCVSPSSISPNSSSSSSKLPTWPLTADNSAYAYLNEPKHKWGGTRANAKWWARIWLLYRLLNPFRAPANQLNVWLTDLRESELGRHSHDILAKMSV